MAKKQAENKEKITALYCRLSVEDTKEGRRNGKEDESNSIQNQKTILAQYARDHGYLHPEFFVDDGISDTTFDRPGFQRMQEMVERGEIGTIIVKDLSRFGREQVEMGRLLQFVYPSMGVTFIAIQENVNTTEKTGLEMMPFYNIFHRCSAYKENRGSCTIHYIREAVLKEIVLEAIQKTARYVQEFEPVFLYQFARQNTRAREQSIRNLKQKIEKSRKRISELDKLFARIYEDNALGRLSDERYARMSADYEKEQKELLAAVECDEQTVRDMEQERIDLKQFLEAMRECTDIKELTPTLLNTLIKRIEVHDSIRDENGVKHVPVDVYFTAVGIINVPDAEEILQIMEEIRTKPLRIA